MECANEYEYNGYHGKGLSDRSDTESAPDHGDDVHGGHLPSRSHGVAMLTVDTVDTVATDVRADADAAAVRRLVYQYAKAEAIKYIGPMTTMLPKRHKM